MGAGLGFGVGLPGEGALAIGLVFGFAIAAPVWLGVPADATKAPSPGVVLRQDRTATLLFGLTLGLPVGLVGGLVVGFPSGLAFGAIGGVGAVLIAGLMAGIAGGVLAGRAYGRVGGCLFAPCGAVLGGLAFEPITIHSNAILGLAGGINLGLAIGFLGVPSRAWGAYTFSHLWLTVRGAQPLQLMRFLDDAYRLGLLRIVGPVYQFRHAALQDHLAPSSETHPVPAPAVNTLTTPPLTW